MTHHWKLGPGWRVFWLAAGLIVSLIAAGSTQAETAWGALPGFAKAGQFDQVLDQLRAETDAESNPKAARLIKDLRQYQQHKSDRLAKRAEAHNEAALKMSEHLAAGRVEEALVKAIEARGLAEDEDGFLALPPVLSVVERAEQGALVAKAAGDWLQALSLYRELDMLFNDRDKYLAQVREAEQRIRMLRFYVPEELQRLYKNRAERLAANAEAANADADNADDEDQEIEPLRLSDDERWPIRLKGVTERMMQDAVRWAGREHVTRPGYKPLLEAGLDNLMLMSDTQGVEDTFKGFADAIAVNRFREGLQRLRQKVQDENKQIDMFLTLIEVMDLNDKTVRLPKSVLVYEFTDGALSALDDFTGVIWPRDIEQFSRNTQGKFYGVGIQISQRNGQILVVSPLEDAPALRAGIRARDVIAQVDGVPTADWSLEKVVREITGPEGTDVTLGIRRAGVAEIIEFTLTRQEIPIRSVRGWSHLPGGGWDFYIDRPSKIGYIRLSQFIPQSAADMDAAINQLQNDAGLEGLILDLRGNPGGLLTAAIEVADRFVTVGPIVSTVDGDRNITRQHRARGRNTYPDFPVVVLINEGSASASEIVAGALQDYQRAFIVGERSFGKGSVQDLFRIARREALLKLTTQYYQLPRGRIIHRKPGATTWGIEPDLRVKMTIPEMNDAFRLRQEVDILRSEGEKPAANPENQDKPAPKVTDLIEQGVDAQLETALMIMKTQVLAKSRPLAQGR